MAASLSQLDPRDAFKPAPAEKWNLKWAAHLYRRAGFGVPPQAPGDPVPAWEALQRSVERGMEKSLEELLAGAEGEPQFGPLMDTLGERISRTSRQPFRGLETDKLQGWWLYRMLHTPHPLLERMTLFWHNHFATSVAKVGKPELMFQQNKLLREHALGKFGPLLHEISRDPAMLLWLDSNSNIKGRANENYARELMELFSLGVGNYTEKDIQEAARAFTGWGTNGGQFAFNEALHDDGSKTVLGRTGNWSGDDVVDIMLEQPVCARFLARKLFRHFISETAGPPDELLEPLAEQLRASDYDIKACLGTLLRSRLFFSEHAYRARIKSPVEYVVGILKAFDARGPMEDLARVMDGLGQMLFAPPNVKGWDGGQEWLNSATLLARHNLAAGLVETGGTFRETINPAALAENYAGKKLADQIDFLLKLLLQGDVGAESREHLLAFATRKEAEPKPHDKLLREVTHTIMLMPEFQLA